MRDDFEFQVDWLSLSGGSTAERNAFGALAIRWKGIPLTELYDGDAKTVRPFVYVSVLHLATWLAANWWRLRWEPRPARLDSEWRMAHELGAAGGGFAWPELQLAADGENISFSCRGTRSHTSDIRYLQNIEGTIDASAFESAVDDLMSRLTERLRALGAEAPELTSAWDEIRAERRDPDIANKRRREALLGCDPGVIGEERLATIIGDGIWMGEAAFDESLAAARAERICEVLEQIKHLSASDRQEWDLSSLDSVRRAWHGVARRFDEPWQRGAELAQLARSELGLGAEDKIDSVRISHLVGGDISTGVDGRFPLALGFRSLKDPRRLTFHGTKPHPHSRRFEVARLIAEALVGPEGERVLPLTDTTTARQKVQRSFAQEFLCPIGGVIRRLPLPEPSDAEIEAVAEHYEVSAYTVQTALVNSGRLDRAYLPRR